MNLIRTFLTKKQRSGYFIMAILIAYVLSKVLFGEPDTAIKTSAIGDLKNLETVAESSLKKISQHIGQVPVIILDKSYKNNNNVLVEVDEEQGALIHYGETNEPFDRHQNLTNNKYKQLVQYHENDGFFNQINELQEGQFRTILDQQPMLIKSSHIERASDRESDQQFALEQGQDRAMIALSNVNLMTQSQNADAEPVGDPYYLAPGQQRIILK